MKKFLALIFIIAPCLVSCTNEEEVNLTNEEVEKLLPEAIYKKHLREFSASDFENKLLGYAWDFKDGYEINPETGETYPFSFYRGGYDENGEYHPRRLQGFLPLLPYFQKDFVYVFVSTLEDGPYYSTFEYTFDEKSKGLYFKNGVVKDFPELFIDKVEGDTLYTISVFTFPEQKPRYVYDKYVKMTPKQLEDWKVNANFVNK